MGMKVAIIPARGGSKRLPRKNIKIFNGKPMITWSIKAALDSNCFDKVIVSTDDYEIANISRAHGAEVPFIRPSDLADDLTTTVPVIAHALSTCEGYGWDIHYACCIYPCAPLIQLSDIKKAFELLKVGGYSYVYPVTAFPHPVQRAMKCLPGDVMQFVYPEYELVRTQDFEEYYYDAAQFYFGKASAWSSQFPMHTAGIGMKIPNWRVVDIDTEDDWRRAELVFSSLKK